MAIEDSADTFIPFVAASGFVAGQIIFTTACMSVEVENGFGFQQEIVEHCQQCEMFVYIRKIAGMERMTIVHEQPERAQREASVLVDVRVLSA